LEDALNGRTQAGFTLIELLVVVAIVGLLAATGMAIYRHSRMRAAETAAVAALHSLNEAQFGFAQTCGNQRYAPTLASLGTPAPATGAAFLSSDMTTGEVVQKSGYQIVMAGTAVTDNALACTGVVPVTSYQATADPLLPGTSGVRYFGTNTDRILYEDAVTFTGNMPEAGPPGHGVEVK
jgi:prepilin-type N-terminal cleavage/methylation domain-containing protein